MLYVTQRDGEDAMSLMGNFLNHASFGETYYAVPRKRPSSGHDGVEGLKALEGESLLGKHNGIVDDALFADLEAEFA